MKLTTSVWDSAEYLDTEEDRAAYLDACLAEASDDPAFIAHALGVVARSRGMGQVAGDTGLTRQGLYKALSEDGNPNSGTVLKVVNALGYRFTVVWEPSAEYAAPAKAGKKRTTSTVAKAGCPEVHSSAWNPNNLEVRCASAEVRWLRRRRGRADRAGARRWA